jgi:hypothetical protein
MSWLNDIVDFGSSALGWLTGSSGGANLARTALSGYALNQLQNSINRENQTDTNNVSSVVPTNDKGVRVQVDPSPDQKIPVVYGRAGLGGIITDAAMVNNNQSMYFCFTLCEQTGNLNLGTGAVSDISFIEIYRNNERLVFDQSGASSGYLCAATIDETGTYNYDLAGLIQVYCYSGSSLFPILPRGYSNGATYNANQIMPGWTEDHVMAGLIFAIVRIDYSKEKNLTGVGDWTFVLENNMTKAGDCLYDYMTNIRYGAGRLPSEVNS